MLDAVCLDSTSGDVRNVAGRRVDRAGHLDPSCNWTWWGLLNCAPSPGSSAIHEVVVRQDSAMGQDAAGHSAQRGSHVTEGGRSVDGFRCSRHAKFRSVLDFEAFSPWLWIHEETLMHDNYHEQ